MKDIEVISAAWFVIGPTTENCAWCGISVLGKRIHYDYKRKLAMCMICEAIAFEQRKERRLKGGPRG